MPQNVWPLHFLIASALCLVPACTLAHIPVLRPYLLALVPASDCVIAGRVVASEASPRGSGVVLLERPVSWCDVTLAPAMRVRVSTALPSNRWYVFFVRQDGAGWWDVSPSGVVFPLERADQRRVHRALRHLWYLRRRPASGEQHAGLFSLLGAQAPEWRYHAALEVHALLAAGARLSPSERQLLQGLLHKEPDGPIRSLLQRLTGAARAPAE